MCTWGYITGRSKGNNGLLMNRWTVHLNNTCQQLMKRPFTYKLCVPIYIDSLCSWKLYTFKCSTKLKRFMLCKHLHIGESELTLTCKRHLWYTMQYSQFPLKLWVYEKPFFGLYLTYKYSFPFMKYVSQHPSSLQDPTSEWRNLILTSKSG